jgi:AhpD family alkylhydroperoxidase
LLAIRSLIVRSIEATGRTANPRYASFSIRRENAPIPRVDLLDASRAPLLARPYYEDGDPGPLVAAFAHVPELLEAVMPFLSAIYGPSALPSRIKEIVILRTSALLACRYCINAHSIVALDSGLSRDEVLALRGSQDAPTHFTDVSEMALLNWIDAVAGSVGPVADELNERFRDHFTEPDLVEITMLVAGTMMLNRFCTALELPSTPATMARLRHENLL